MRARPLLPLVAGLALWLLASGCAREPRRGKEPSEPARQQGVASWYGARHQGKRTASGERFNRKAYTAAHPKLRFGTCVRVRVLKSGREVQVRINDRGPYGGGRIIDLSEAAAVRLGIREQGTAHVELLPCR